MVCSLYTHRHTRACIQPRLGPTNQEGIYQPFSHCSPPAPCILFPHTKKDGRVLDKVQPVLCLKQLLDCASHSKSAAEWGGSAWKLYTVPSQGGRKNWFLKPLGKTGAPEKGPFHTPSGLLHPPIWWGHKIFAKTSVNFPCVTS